MVDLGGEPVDDRRVTGHLRQNGHQNAGVRVPHMSAQRFHVDVSAQRNDR
ncbi:hypothetical protein ACQ86B_12210 [Mycolicibacterium aichiense]